MVGIDPSLQGKVTEDMKRLSMNGNLEENVDNVFQIDSNPLEFDFGGDSLAVSVNDKQPSVEEIKGPDSTKSEEPRKDAQVDMSPNVKVNDVKAEDTNYYFDVKNGKLAYDVIPLPSKGEVYKEKIPKLSVAYLTAESENLITSPHLYKDDLIIDALLKYHVQNKGFDTDELISGDVDAIMLWLRATGYGNEYPIIVTDPDTKQEFETSADLSQLKIKDFDLKGDENGWFDFTLPIINVPIKFKYLSRKEERQLQKVSEMESDNSRNEILRQDYVSMVQCLKSDRNLSEESRKTIKGYLDALSDQWIGMSMDGKIRVSRTVTNRLEMSVMSVDGNTDKGYIRDFIKRIPAMDSLKLRRYIEEHRPGVDWNITVQKPVSLGGGSMEIFLEWSADAFLNIR